MQANSMNLETAVFLQSIIHCVSKIATFLFFEQLSQKVAGGLGPQEQGQGFATIDHKKSLRTRQGQGLISLCGVYMGLKSDCMLV